MADFDDDSYAACKMFIKNINWFVQRKSQYLSANFQTWTTKNGTVYDAFKDCVDTMAFAKTDLMVEKYFKYMLDKHLQLEMFERKFLEGKDDLEILFENVGLENHKLVLLGTTAKSKTVSDITNEVKNLKITSKIMIDVLSGTEADEVEDWFEKFEIKANAVDWTDQVKGVRLPAYLADLALVVWKTQSTADKVNYKASKKNILKELIDENTFEQRFYGKKQKECETILEFYYKLVNDAEKIFEDVERKKSNILKVFWYGLKFEVRKMVAGAGTPLSIEAALEAAKNAEKFLREKQERPEKVIAAVSKKSPERNSRRWDQKEITSRGDRSKSPDRSFDRTKRWATPFRSEGSSRCWNCNEEGHISRECPKERKQVFKGSKSKCFYCQKEGHLINKCYARLRDEASTNNRVKD